MLLSPAKNYGPDEAWRHIFIYAFSARQLDAFVAPDGKTRFESIEDIEILRFVEQGISVKMVRLASGGIAVDFHEDGQGQKRLPLSALDERFLECMNSPDRSAQFYSPI